MGRKDYRHYRTTCSKGINQQAELIGPGEVIDARNVWAPNGKLQSRPGFRNEGSIGREAVSWTPLDSVITETDIDGTPSFQLYGATPALTNKIAADTHIYFVYITDPRGASARYAGLRFEMTTAAQKIAFGSWEYYDGSDWRPLSVVNESTSVAYDATSFWYGIFLPQGSPLYQTSTFKPPSDWAAVTVHTKTNKFMVRVRLCVNESGTGNVVLAATRSWSEETAITELLANVKFSNRTRFITAARSIGDTSTTLNVASDVRRNWQRTLTLSAGRDRGHSSIAVVPQFDEVFLCYSGTTARTTPVPKTTDDPYARVETDASIVGSKAPYDPAYISQESSWPLSDFILFFKGRLWSAYESVVRWSAPQPAHKVWPKISQEPIMEDDNSDITGLVGFGEHVVVFKRESIYIMPSIGENQFALEHYTPVRVVSGVGCISPESIQKIRGRLVFLSEDGLYAFDGTPNIKKVTEKAYKNVDGSAEMADRMADFFSQLNKGYRRLATSVHWVSKRCYLLSLSLGDDIDNGTTLVWDYANDSFWVWAGFNAKRWMAGDGIINDDLFFVDDLGFIYRFGYGHDDHHEAIESYVTTHRIGYRQGDKKRFRQVDATLSNTCKSLSIDVIPQDNEPNKASATVSTTDAIEKLWSDTITDLETEWSSTQKRSVRVGFRVDSDFSQVKITHDTRDQPFELTLLDVGWIPLGDR